MVILTPAANQKFLLRPFFSWKLVHNYSVEFHSYHFWQNLLLPDKIIQKMQNFVKSILIRDKKTWKLILARARVANPFNWFLMTFTILKQSCSYFPQISLKSPKREVGFFFWENEESLAEKSNNKDSKLETVTYSTPTTSSTTPTTSTTTGCSLCKMHLNFKKGGRWVKIKRVEGRPKKRRFFKKEPNSWDTKKRSSY